MWDCLLMLVFSGMKYQLLLNMNLVLAMVTSLQAPIIMMSQNREAQKDRLRADLDYEVNLKNELLLTEIRNRLYEEQQSARTKPLNAADRLGQ